MMALLHRMEVDSLVVQTAFSVWVNSQKTATFVRYKLKLRCL